mgnify:CR=1 FL=1
MSSHPSHPSRVLSEFLAGLRYEDVPASVIARTEDLYLDWFASALAGKGARQIDIMERYIDKMGPSNGPSTILVNRKNSSPYFAALVNGASSHLVEQDDVHNGSVFHPAAVAGYEAGIRIGEFLGRSHYRIFHTTGTAGTLAAAVAVGKLMDFNADQFLHALGSAGTQAAGLWEFLRDAADSKQLHTGKAAADGLLAAYITRDGFTGAQRILEGAQGMAAGMSTDADPAKLTDRLGERWATAETSFKFHASCRHTHPAADALQLLMQREGLQHDQIAAVNTRVHQGAIDVLGPVVNPQTVHQAKFSMGTVLGLIAVHQSAGLGEFEQHALHDGKVSTFRDKVRMTLDDEVNAAYPARWLGRVEVDTVDGRHLSAAVDVPKGDPDNTLSRGELEDKAQRLIRFSNAATPQETDRIIAHAWQLHTAPVVNDALNNLFAR